MISFSETEIIKSLIYSFIFGCALGVVKSGISVFLNCMEDIVKMPKDIFKVSYDLKLLPHIFKVLLKSQYSHKKTQQFVKDFIFVLLYGISFSILLYITLDGKFRFYILFISLAATLVFDRFLGRAIDKFLDKLLSILRAAITAIIAIFLSPFVFVFRRIYRLLSKIVSDFKFSIKKKDKNG